MSKITVILAITIFGFACRQSNSLTDRKKHKQQTGMVGSENVSEAKSRLAKVDSIEKANNESVDASEDDITKAFIPLSDGDSTIYLTSNIKKDHRIFGYAKPDPRSERLLLLSVFTSDVENNPFGCKLGSYYDTSGFQDLKLKYISTTGNFVKARAVGANNLTTIFFEKKWLLIE